MLADYNTCSELGDIFEVVKVLRTWWYIWSCQSAHVVVDVDAGDQSC